MQINSYHVWMDLKYPINHVFAIKPWRFDSFLQGLLKPSITTTSIIVIVIVHHVGVITSPQWLLIAFHALLVGLISIHMWLRLRGFWGIMHTIRPWSLSLSLWFSVSWKENLLLVLFLVECRPVSCLIGILFGLFTRLFLVNKSFSKNFQISPYVIGQRYIS